MLHLLIVVVVVLIVSAVILSTMYVVIKTIIIIVIMIFNLDYDRFSRIEIVDIVTFIIPEVAVVTVIATLIISITLWMRPERSFQHPHY